MYYSSWEQVVANLMKSECFNNLKITSINLVLKCCGSSNPILPWFKFHHPQGRVKIFLTLTFWSKNIRRWNSLLIYLVIESQHNCLMLCYFRQSSGLEIAVLEFFLNVFIEFAKFSHKNNTILKRLLYSNPLSPECNSTTVPHRYS